MENNDPIVLYLVVREDLNMSRGKIAAQIGHAVQTVLMKYFQLQLLSTKKLEQLHLVSDNDHIHIKETTEWMEKGLSTKIVLSANEKNWNALKQEMGKNCFIVKDAGKTEIEPNTETTIVIWPQHKSGVSNIIKHLPLLK